MFTGYQELTGNCKLLLVYEVRVYRTRAYALGEVVLMINYFRYDSESTEGKGSVQQATLQAFTSPITVDELLVVGIIVALIIIKCILQ